MGKGREGREGRKEWVLKREGITKGKEEGEGKEEKKKQEATMARYLIKKTI